MRHPFYNPGVFQGGLSIVCHREKRWGGECVFRLYLIMFTWREKALQKRFDSRLFPTSEASYSSLNVLVAPPSLRFLLLFVLFFYIPPATLSCCSMWRVLCIVHVNGSWLHPLSHRTKTQHAAERQILPVRAATALSEPVFCLILRHFFLAEPPNKILCKSVEY